MSFGDVIGLATLILGIVAVIGIMAGVYTRRLAFHQRKLEILASQADERADCEAARAGALEERLRVLERIVTDRSYAIDTQIDALRDPRPASVQIRSAV